MSNRRDGLSAESSQHFAGKSHSTSSYGRGQRGTGNSWASNRPSGMPGVSRRSHRQYNGRRNTTSRTGDPADAFAPIKLIDEQGVNRTPKPLVAIVTSAALRQARGIPAEESVIGSEPSEAVFGNDLLSSAGFSRGWFDSGQATPQEASAIDLDYQSGGRYMVPGNAALPSTMTADRSLHRLSSSNTTSGMRATGRARGTGSLGSSARPTGTPPSHGSISQRLTSEDSEKPVKASTWDMHDSYAAMHQAQQGNAEEQLGSVLPSGAVVATGAPSNGFFSSSHASSVCSSSQNFNRASNMSSVLNSAAAAGHGRATARDSSMTGGWGSIPSGTGKEPLIIQTSHEYAKSSSLSGNKASAAMLAAAGVARQAEPWTTLDGLAEALAVMEAAIAQNTFLPQLLLYRDIKLPAAASSESGGVAEDVLSGGPSLSGMNASSSHLTVVPPSPGRGAMMSAVPTPGALAAGDSWVASSPHGPAGASSASLGTLGSNTGSLTAAGVGSMAGLSRRGSVQLMTDILPQSSRQSFLASGGSSRTLRTSRPPASLQLLWTWSSSTTGARPVTGIAWNCCNKCLLAAGYGSLPAPVPAAGSNEANGEALRPSSVEPAGAHRASGSGSLADGGEYTGDDGAAGAAATAGGKVALWSMKNQFHPVWCFDTKSAVTGVTFSKRNPHILAVGMHDGTIAVYDVRSRQLLPLMSSTAQTGKHLGPVWKVRWVDRGPEREELLVSISTDGKVKAWTIAKGLDHSTLITLKRIPRRPASATPGNPATAAGGSSLGTPAHPAGSAAKAVATVAALRGTAGGDRDALISRNTGGMSFDFSGSDTRIYLAGTEDGHIHKCSTSYSEQYLESYTGHIGPVYALQWSPFNKSLFISCSGDWTIRLWQERRQQQLLSFQSSNEEVLDVQWCPFNSTVFGAVTAGGRLELWDFSASTLRPVAQHTTNKCSMTALLFGVDAPVVVAANDAGGLMVFRLVNIAAHKSDPVELQHTRLDEALRANGWRVFAGVRSESSLLQLQEMHPDISPIQLDVTKPESIAAASDLVQAAVGDKGLQLLVNNAGVGVVAPLEHLPLSEYRAIFDVNLFGVVSTSQAFLPLLRQGPVKGRIINVGSVAGHLNMPFWSAYCSSKAALEAVSECLRFELAAQGVPVVVIKPGPVATAIWDKSGHRSAQVVDQLPPAAREMYGLQIDTMLQEVQLTQQKASPVNEVLQTIYTAATCLEPQSKYNIGDTAALYYWMKRLLPDWLWEQMLLSAYGDAFQKRRS
eukprot:gene12390-12525_t